MRVAGQSPPRVMSSEGSARRGAGRGAGRDGGRGGLRPGRGRGRGREAKGSRALPDRDAPDFSTRLSKRMSHLLRHGAVEAGLARSRLLDARLEGPAHLDARRGARDGPNRSRRARTAPALLDARRGPAAQGSAPASPPAPSPPKPIAAPKPTAPKPTAAPVARPRISSKPTAGPPPKPRAVSRKARDFGAFRWSKGFLTYQIVSKSRLLMQF